MTPDQQRHNIATYIHDIEIAIDNHPLWKESDLFDIASLKEEIKAEIFNKIYSSYQRNSYLLNSLDYSITQKTKQKTKH